MTLKAPSSGPSSILPAAMDEILVHEILNQEQEKDLFLQCGEPGQRDAKSAPAQRLLSANMRLVYSLAKKRVHDSGISIEDLFQEGCIGLMTAFQKFDVTRGFKFSTCAVWWINQNILFSCAKNKSIVYVPPNGANVPLAKHIKDFIASHEKKFGEKPSAKELCAFFQIDFSRLNNALELAALSVEPLDAPFLRETGVSFDPFGDGGAAAIAVEQRVFAADTARILDIALKRLPPRQGRLLELRHGLIDGEQRSLQAVGDDQEFCLTRERIRQIEERALRRLRRILGKPL